MASLYDSASLVMIPSGYKDDKLYSIKPTDGSGDFTFSRDGAGASPATRVNASGLIEKGRENLILQSNQFDTTWSNNRSYETSGQADPDGGTNAWKFREDANTGTHILQQNLTPSAGVYTFSVTAKAAERSGVQVLVEGALSYGFANFDLTDGSVQNSGQLGFITFIDATSVDLGGGWYRLSVSVYSSISLAWTKFYLLDGSFSTSYTGIDGNGIFVYQSQVEQGLVATDYIATTTAPVSAGLLGDMPRLDYSGGATCPSLLLEPSRVNSLANSEYFGAWTATGASVSDNNAESPEGVNNAATISVSSTNDRVSLNGSSFVSGDTYTASVYLKGTGTISLNIGTSSGGGVENEEQITLTNDWVRHDITYTAPSTTGSWRLMLIKRSGDTATAFDVYGAQLESGSYPTSYIPTYGSASTRGADDCSLTSASAIIGQSEGVIYLEVDQPYTNGVQGAWSISDGSSSNRITMNTTDDTATNFVFSVATNYAGSGTSLVSADANYIGTHKVAIKYSGTTIKLFVDGALSDSTTTTGFGNFNQFHLGSNQTGAASNEQRIIKQSLLFTSALTDAECIALTTL